VVIQLICFGWTIGSQNPELKSRAIKTSLGWQFSAFLLRVMARFFLSGFLVLFFTPVDPDAFSKAFVQDQGGLTL